MCGLFGGGGHSSPAPAPIPSIVPGATDVSAGKVANDSESAMNRILEQQRKKRGVATTIRNEGGAAGMQTTQTGKRLLGE